MGSPTEEYAKSVKESTKDEELLDRHEEFHDQTLPKEYLDLVLHCIRSAMLEGYDDATRKAV